MNPMAVPRTTLCRAGLTLLLLLAFVSELMLIAALRPHGGANIVQLELARTATEFAQIVQRDWTQEAAGPTPATPDRCGLDLPHTRAPVQPHWGKLRCSLLVDSLGLVPGYVGLLLLLTLGCLAPGAPLAQRLAWCLPALAAGCADLTENGLTWQALDLLDSAALSDAAVAGVRLASRPSGCCWRLRWQPWAMWPGTAPQRTATSSAAWRLRFAPWAPWRCPWAPGFGNRPLAWAC